MSYRLANQSAVGVSEGSRVKCVYCPGTVTLDYVQEEPGGFEDGGVVVTFCEGVCDHCGRRVDYDYEPKEL